MNSIERAIDNLKTASLENDQAKEVLETVTYDFTNMLYYPNTVTNSEILKYNNIVEHLISDAELRKKIYIQQKKWFPLWKLIASREQNRKTRKLSKGFLVFPFLYYIYFF